MGQEDVTTITKEASILQTIPKAIGILGGGTAIFYALGFTIVNTYIRRVGLEGMFWLTKEFYVDAGAKFLLEMIRSPLLAPQLFFSYLFLLYFIVPKEKNLFEPSGKNEGQSDKEAVFTLRQWVKLYIVFFIILGTFLFATYFNYMQTSPFFLSVIRIANFFDVDKALLSSSLANRETSLAFFSFITPLIIILGNFFYRFRGALKERSKSRLYYQTAFIIYVIFLASLPVSYANHLYDWKLVPLKNPEIVEHVINPGRETTQFDTASPLDAEFIKKRLGSTHIWLLGQSEDQYLFLTKSGMYSEGVIEVIDATRIEHLNFAYDPNQGDYLSKQIKPHEEEKEEDNLLNDNPLQYIKNVRAKK